MAKTEQEASVTPAAFLAALAKKKAALVKGAKEERRQGYLDDAGILAKLGIDEGMRKSFPASVSKVAFSFAKGDAARPAFRFSYIIDSTDPRAKGTVVSNYYILEEGVKSDGTVWQTEEEAAAKISAEFQGIGDDTKGWGHEEFLAAAQEHTKNKTEVSVTVSCYRNKNNELKINVLPNPALGDSAPADNSDLDESEPADDFDGSAWVGYYIEFQHESVDGTVRMLVEEYDEASDCFIGTDDNGEKWEGDYAISTQQDWAASETQASE